MVLGAFQLVEYPERGVMMLNELLTGDNQPRQFIVLSRDVRNVADLLKLKFDDEKDSQVV